MLLFCSGLLRSWTSPNGRSLSLLRRRRRLTPMNRSSTPTASAPPCSSRPHLSHHAYSGRGRRSKTAPGWERYGRVSEAAALVFRTAWWCNAGSSTFALDRNNARVCLFLEEKRLSCRLICKNVILDSCQVTIKDVCVCEMVRERALVPIPRGMEFQVAIWEYQGHSWMWGLSS